MSDEIVTRIEQQEARIAVLRDALDTLVHVVGLTAIKYPSQLPPLQEARDLALKALKEDAAERERADRNQEDAGAFRSRSVVGWLRGHKFIGLPEESQEGDVPVYVFDSADYNNGCTHCEAAILAEADKP